MKRKQITQIINTKWCPQHLKILIAEFLSWFVVKVNATKPFVPVIEDTLENSGYKNIINIDLKIGAGIESLAQFLNPEISISNVPYPEFSADRKGLYLFANGFHQLPEKEAAKVLKTIAENGHPVVVVEGNNDSLWQIVGMTVFVPLTVLLTAPFVKPFRFSRIFFTYLFPVLPIIILVDGCLALLKLYNPKDLLELTVALKVPNFQWTAGKNDNNRGGKIIYLTGQKI
ncbi:MAG: hypothetical protein AAF705_09440 [Bacteroidota bacterium]